MNDMNLPLLVEPCELADRLQDDRLLIIDLSMPSAYQRGHVPGALRLDYPSILYSHDNTDCDVPPVDVLNCALSAIGLTPEHHVVAYDGQGNPMACRLLWTLEYLGHTRFSLLNGGWEAWQREGNLPEEQSARMPCPSHYRAARSGNALATKDYILGKLDAANVLLLDTRTHEEFTNELIITDRGGCIPGAVHFDWLQTIDDARGKRLRPDDDLRELLDQRGVVPEKEVIAYCQTHMRSAHTYFVLKYLGFSQLLGYAAGYSEWGNDLETPVANECRMDA